MERLQQSLREQLDALSLDQKEARLRRLERRVAELTRELEEVSQRIPFWDRVVFFDDTEDEARAKALESRLEETTAELEELQETVRLDREAVAAEYPPYDLARRIHRCRRLSRDIVAESGVLGGLEVPDELIEELEMIGEIIPGTWVADHDPEELRHALVDENQRKRFADDDVNFAAADAQLGWAPIDQRTLISACASVLQEGRYEEIEQAIAELEDSTESMETALVRTADEVSLLDKLNFISTSAEEARAEATERALSEAEEQIERRTAERLHLVESTFRAFPPLAVQIAAHEALGAVRALEATEMPRLAASGMAMEVPRVEGQPLLLAALERLVEAFEEAFPGVPTMLTSAAPPRRGGLRNEFARGLEDRGGYTIVERALAQAHLHSSSRAMREQVDDRVGWLDRAVFWSDTEDEDVLERLDENIPWYRERFRALVRRLDQLAREEGAQHPPLLLRDWALWSDAAVAAIHTDPGQSSIPKNCSVYGREKALNGLGNIRQTLERAYGFRGGRRAFVHDVADCLRQEETHRVEERDVGFEPLPYDEIVARVARRLTGTDFGLHVERVEEFESAWTRADASRTETEAEISIWDRINIFTTTESEAKRDELRDELDDLGRKLDIGIAQLDELIEGAMAAYPPARLYYRLESVVEAVQHIRAVCRSRTVTVGTGKNRRTETRYYCALEGKSEAVETMRWWTRTFLQVFGSVPTYDALLEHWVLHR